MTNTDYTRPRTQKPCPSIPEGEALQFFAPARWRASPSGLPTQSGLREGKRLSVSHKHFFLSRGLGLLAFATCLTAYILPFIGIWTALSPIVL